MNGNKLRSLVVLAMIVSLFAFMTACAQQQVAPPVEETAMVEEPAPVVEEPAEEPMVEEEMGTEEPLESEPMVMEETEPQEGRTSPGMLPVYFDFDKSVVRADQVERMEKNAAFLKDNPDTKVRVEGNCDERGTNEYNMALGQRRAMSGKKYLVNLGVEASRLDTISYGEEQPINFGHDELSWSQNRRDDFVIAE